MRVSSILRKFSTVLLLAGAVVLGCCAFVIARAHVFQWREARFLAFLLTGARQGAQAGHADNLPAREPRPKLGALFGELQIPRLNLDTIVVQGDDSSILRSGAGHIPYTAMPDDPGGNVAIAAHRDSYFRPLRLIRPDDLIVIKTPAGVHRYRVQSIRVTRPGDIALLDNTGQRTLTLVTCYPFYYVGSAPDRFIVRATAAD